MYLWTKYYYCGFKNFLSFTSQNRISWEKFSRESSLRSSALKSLRKDFKTQRGTHKIIVIFDSRKLIVIKTFGTFPQHPIILKSFSHELRRALLLFSTFWPTWDFMHKNYILWRYIYYMYLEWLCGFFLYN